MESPKKKICIFGSANADHFLYVKEIPQKGETVQSLNYLTANGGKGANQAVSVGKLAGKSWFIGQVGNDDAHLRLKKEMEGAQVELHWRVLENQPTGMAYIYVDQHGENSIVIYGGANMKYQDLEDIEPAFKEVIDQCDYLLLQKETPMSLVLAAAKYAKNKGKVVILDCGGQDSPITEQLLTYISYISPNETELKRIDETIEIGEEFNLQAVTQDIRVKLLTKHPKLRVLLKLGSKGSAIITNHVAVWAPTATTVNPLVLKDFKIIDTVGAGDCFTGAYAVRHSELDWSDNANKESNYRAAMQFGNSAAFLCITKPGAMPSMPHREEVNKFMETYSIK